MKQNLIIPALTLVVGIGIGVAVDRTVVTIGQQGGYAEGQSSAVPVGPRGSSDGPDSRAAGSGLTGKMDRNPVAAIRRISKQMELSPMISMDFEAMLEAYEAIRWMGPDDIRVALAELENSKGMNQGAMMLRFMLMGLWAKTDGKGAMEYATKLTQPMDKMMSVMSGVMGWMKHDPGNAYQWYKDNRGELGGGLMGGMGMDGMFIASLAQQDMDTAFKELGELSGQNRNMALSMMAGTLAMDEAKRKEFLGQLEKMEDETLKQSGMSAMMSTWAMTDPQGAVGYLEAMNPKPENHAELLQSAASSWGMMDPEGAIQWQLKNVGEGEVAGDKIARTFGQWAASDADAADRWLAKQPADMATDEFYSRAVTSSAWINAEGSTRWAVKIQDQDKRKNALSTIHSSMQTQGEKALSKWMDGLDPKIRGEVETLRKEQEPTGGEMPIPE